MTNVIDLTRATMAPYRLAEIIEHGNYSDVVYFEFHSPLNPENTVYESSRLSSFHEASQDYYSTVISNSYPDEFEAVIDVAIKLGSQWFILRQCGANYYLGFGPQGILKLRNACSIRRIPIIISEDKIDEWLKNQSMDKATDVQNEFEFIVNIIRNMGADFERRPIEYRGIKEESIRDRLLAPINGALQGRAHAESKNRKGKTDILIRTKDGNNEFIFELKVWNGPSTVENTINQLSGYLSWNNKNAGIVMINYKKDFTRVLNTTRKVLHEKFELMEPEIGIEREYRFRLWNNSDNQKHTDVTLMFINLCE